ncbi:ATP-binding protein, partial [Leucobacter soli]
LRRPPGLLGAVLAARGLGFERVMVPDSCAREAALVPGIEVIAVRDLAGALAWYRGDADGWRVGASDDDPSDTAERPEGADRSDMAEVIGQPEAVEAMVVAAAGRHHLSMVGPPGAGKTLLATRLPTILPDLDEDEQIVASSIASLGGNPLTELVTRPPFESPHHTASSVSIIGGGAGGAVRPGAITRACHGVLFLDETPQFPSAVLDGLRQPLESGTVEIHRAKVRALLPARVQLILAANPCPCGNAGSPETAAECRCTPLMRTRYLGRVSGPLVDRIDLRLSVRRISSALPALAEEPRPTSAQLRRRVVEARARAADRLRGTPWCVNAEV